MKAYQKQPRQLPDFANVEALTLAAPPIPQRDLPHGLSMIQVLAIAKHYWKQAAVIAGCFFVFSALLIKLLPKTYVATATLIIDLQQPNSLPAQQFPGNDLANYVATQLELIASPIVLLPVVDQLQLTNDSDFISGFRGTSLPAMREFAEKRLAQDIDVKRGLGDELLYIAVSAATPTKAAAIANAIADAYLRLDRQRANDPISQQAQQSAEELGALRVKVTAAQDKVTAFRQHNGLTSLTASSNDTEMQGLAALETHLLQVQNERRALEARQVGQVSDSNEALDSNRISNLKGTLSGLQAQLAQLRPTLGPRHPQILALEAQIKSTRQSLNQAVTNLSDNVSTQLTRTRDLENELAKAVAQQRATVLHLRGIQDEGNKLELELESAQSVYKHALDGYDQVKFAAVRNFANVSLVSRATPPIQASKPSKLGLLAMSAIAALGFGLGLPFCYELWLDRRLRCRDDLERGLSIPVLAELDAIQLPSRSA